MDIDPKNELELLLLDLESKEEQIRAVAKLLMQPGEVEFFPLDFITIAVMNRALSNIYGFTGLIRQDNYGSAAALVRLHLDSLLRLYACWIYPRPHELANEILSGKPIDKFQDENGAMMHDSHLATRLSEQFPWIINVYKQTSGYIHLSNKHISLSSSINTENMMISGQISRFDHVSNEVKKEAINCMVEITNIQLEFLKGWNYTKRNPETVERIKHIDLITKMNLKSDFSNAKGIIKYLDENLKEFEGYFENIKGLLLKPANDENYTEAFHNFKSIFEYVPLMATFIKEEMIVRARPNYNGELFSIQSELSYHPDPKYVKAGRFNAPGVTLFYGALQVDKSEVNVSLTSCLECCKGLISKTNPVSLQDLTMGIWHIKEVLPVVNLCFDDLHLKTNIPLKKQASHYLKQLRKNYSIEAYDFIKGMLNFLSTLSSTRDEDNDSYYVLSALFEALRYYYSEVMQSPFTGLIFPSSATEGIGLNIVLVPPAVDHCLSLEKVGMQRFVLNSKNGYDSQPCCDLADVSDGNFKIANYTPFPT
jgi:hypothetical protein